jgi:hypothetical protein
VPGQANIGMRHGDARKSAVVEAGLVRRGVAVGL